MTDIYDIKDILLSFPINITYSLIYLLFLFILFFIYKYLINNNKEIKIDNKVEEVKIEKENIDFEKIIKDFEKKYLEKDEKIFYSKLIFILRDLLEYKGEKNISKMTYKQITNLKLNDNLKKLIKNIYYKEYEKDIIDNNEVRKKFIEDIKKIIK